MSDERYFIPWRALKPRVFWSFLVVWHLLFLLSAFLNRGHGGAALTPASSIVAVIALAFALVSVLFLLFSGRAQEAALRTGQGIESCRTQLWGIAATLAFLVVAFSVQAFSAL